MAPKEEMAGSSDRRGAGADRSGRWLLLLGLIFSAIYFATYPRTYSILDEQGFLSFAMVLAKGTVKADEAGVFVVREALVNGHAVPGVGLGTVLLLVPAVLVYWKSAYLLMLAVHLLGFWAASRALASAGLPRLYAALYLLFPPAALYARTAMSELPTAVLMLFGLWAYLARPAKPFWAGFLWGLTPFFRFAQIALLLGLGLARLLKDLAAWRRTRRLNLGPSLYLALGFAPGLIAWLIVNAWLYGGPLDTPLIWPLSASYLPSHLWRYLLVLNLLYPLMLVVALLRRSPLRLEAALASLATLLLYSLFKHRYEGFGPAALVIGYRFFLPLIGLLLIPYAAALEDGRQRLRRAARPMAWGLLLLLVAGTAVQSWAHARRLLGQEELQREVYAITAEAGLILLDSGAREYFFDAVGPRPLLYVREFPFSAEVRAAVDARLPAVLLLVLERADMPPDPADAELLAEVQRLYDLAPVDSLGSYPDCLLVYRLQGRRETGGP